MKIRLEANGELVARFVIPPFQTAPLVVIWGDRVFSALTVWKDQGDDVNAVYSEVFAYAIVSDPVQ